MNKKFAKKIVEAAVSIFMATLLMVSAIPLVAVQAEELDTTELTEVLSSNADLASLTTNSVDISEEFDPEKKTYSIELEKQALYIRVIFETADPDARVYVNDELTEYRNVGVTLNKTGQTRIRIRVVAPDGETSKTYTVNVKNAPGISTDSALKSLVFSDGLLTPSFSSSVKEYTLLIPGDVTEIVATPTTRNDKARVTLSDSPFSSMTFRNIKYGETVKEFVVTAESGAKSTYTVTFNRKANLTSEDFMREITLTEGITGGTVVAPEGAIPGSMVELAVTPDKGYELKSLTVRNELDRKITVEDNKFVMPEGKATVKATFAKIKYFTDVAESRWYYEPVWYVRTEGIMYGMTEDTFGTSSGLTRLQFWIALMRMDTKETNITPEQAKNWVIEKGLSDGTNENSQITREQLVTILHRYEKLIKDEETNIDKDGLDSFTDAKKISSYATDSVAWAVNEGLLQGTNGRINPKDNVSRVEFAAFVQRFMTR